MRSIPNGIYIAITLQNYDNPAQMADQFLLRRALTAALFSVFIKEKGGKP